MGLRFFLLQGFWLQGLTETVIAKSQQPKGWVSSEAEGHLPPRRSPELNGLGVSGFRVKGLAFRD